MTTQPEATCPACPGPGCNPDRRALRGACTLAYDATQEDR